MTVKLDVAVMAVRQTLQRRLELVVSGARFTEREPTCGRLSVFPQETRVMAVAGRVDSDSNMCFDSLGGGHHDSSAKT